VDDNRFDQPSVSGRGMDSTFSWGLRKPPRAAVRSATGICLFLSARDNDNADVPFGYPADVALSRQGELYVIDGDNKRILKVKGASTVEKSFGGFDAGGVLLIRLRAWQ